MEKRAGNDALNFERIKSAYEEVCGERAQLRTALESASDVVRRQKDLVRRQAGEIVSIKREASLAGAEAQKAQEVQTKEAQAREDALRDELRLAVLRAEEAQSNAGMVKKKAQMEAERTTDLALAELRSQQVAKVEKAVNAAKKRLAAI